MKLYTDAIETNGLFDPRYTCDVDNSSPELRWDDVPAECQSFVLIAEDLDHPDGSFAHWVVYNIPSGLRHLPTGIPPQDALPNGIRQGLNGFGKLGYAGPCPPRRSEGHRYRFTLHALKEAPLLPARCSRDKLLEQVTPLIIASASIEGRYQRILERVG